MAKRETDQTIDKLYKYVTSDLRKDLGEDFVTKKEFKNATNEIFNILDKQTVILNRLDQERIFTFNFVKRLEKDIDRNTKDIKILKAKLNI